MSETETEIQADTGMVNRIEKVIEDGNKNPESIAYALGSNLNVVVPVLNALGEVGYLEREENEDFIGNFEYHLGDTSLDVAVPTEDEIENNEMSRFGGATDDFKMPTNRDEYDFSDRIPSDVPTFYQTDGEMDEIRADLKQSERIAEAHGIEKARLPRFLFSGPTGCGKTHAARKIAEEEDAVLFTIQGKYSMNEADLIGMPLLVGNETVWVDGPLTKALIASQDNKVVLLIDEGNRARPEAKSAFFSILDDRCSIEIEARGGEVIQGDPINLITVTTINEGDGYHTQKMDLAELRRYGHHHEMTYLGMENEEAEIDLITERSLAPRILAEEIVAAANEVREEAANAGEVKRGIPTALLIDWARTAFSYSAEELPNPVLRAGRTTVTRAFYRNDNDQFVEDTISDRLDGAPALQDELEEWAGKDMNEFVSDAPDAESE